MTFISVLRQMLFGLTIMTAIHLQGNADALVTRAETIKNYVEFFSAVNTMRVQIKVIHQNLLEDEKDCSISIGTYILRDTMSAFEHTRFFGLNKEQCEQHVEGYINAGYGRIVRTVEKVYSQYGLDGSGNVTVTSGGADLHPAEPVFILESFKPIASMFDRIFQEQPFIREMKPERVRMPDGTSTEKYRFRTAQDIDGNYSLYAELFFESDGKNALPLFYQLSSVDHISGDSLIIKELSIKTNVSSPLGFDEFTTASYRLGQPNTRTQVILTSTPEIDLPVFDDEFNFYVQSGKAMEILEYGKRESFVAEEDMVIKP